jgi:DNA-binding beta-propeller fold protein YncE
MTLPLQTVRARRGGAIILCAGGVVVFLAVGCALTSPGSATSNATAGVVAGTIPFGSIRLDGSPGVPAVNTETGTLYVPIQCPTPACATGSTVVDVINTARCNAEVASACQVVARASVGVGPQAIAIDEATDTIYVPDSSGDTSLLSGARCSARVTSGCGTIVATINVGGIAAALDPATRTLYVADPEGGIHMIDAAACNAVTPNGCRYGVWTVTDNDGPQAVAVDVATDTVYAVNNGSGNGNTVSVIDGATCNRSNSSGCGLPPRTVTVGTGASWDAVDQATDTVYVANKNDGTVSVIDGARCNASTTSGCASTPLAVPTAPGAGSVVDTAQINLARFNLARCNPSRTSGCAATAFAVSVGAGAAGVAVDDSLHTVFTVNQNDDTLSAINTRTCDGTTTSGCPKRASSGPAGANQGSGYNGFPNSVTLDPHTDTAYLVSLGGSDVLAVVNVGDCNAIVTSSCRDDSPSVLDPEFEATVDTGTDTIYASNSSLPEIDVLNGATCAATRLSGCAPIAEIPMPDAAAAMGAIDDTTYTLYASDSYGRTVSVINIANCNATDIAGCAAHPRTINVGAEPGSPVLNTATRTLYLPFATSADEIAVLNAGTCNAEVSTGCGQTPGVVNVGEGTAAIAVSSKTNTIYAPSGGIPDASGDTMSVINGATCNGTDHAGCGKPAATVQVGPGPYGVAVNDDSDTVYVANDGGGDVPGTVSIIDGATCNGSHTAGCTATVPAVPVGRGPHLVVVDSSADFVYITDQASAQVSELNGATCNAAVMSGCTTLIEQAVGSQPTGLAFNPDTNTVYAMTILKYASMSVFGGGA